MKTITKTQARAYRSAAVNSNDPGKLILLLYEGAIRYLGVAIEKIGQKRMEEGHNFIVRAKSIVAELMASLNMRDGNDISVHLQAIYAYMYDRLIDANLNKDPTMINEVRELLKTLYEGWETIYKRGQCGENQGVSHVEKKNEVDVSI